MRQISKLNIQLYKDIMIMNQENVIEQFFFRPVLHYAEHYQIF